ncbi:hypothetical protein [Streptomyces sp. Midd1]|uniref:hypothetical protein n=1 Tax=Streptomyces sp. Midd3 TaxID=3161191 RepID=UPI0034DB5B4E
MQKSTLSLTESAQSPPTKAEVEAATRILMRAWAPDVRLPGDPEPVYDPSEDDPYEGCGCAGDDEYGNPRGCNCADNCSCDSCSYYRYRRQMTCSAGDVDGVFCTRQTSHRVVAYAMQHNYLSVPRSAGVACPHETGVQTDTCHCTAKAVFVESGLRPVTYWTQTACSVEHAQAMVARHTDQRGEQSGVQYYIERWTYEPHSHDLPPGLAELRTQLRTASSGVNWAVDLSFSGRTGALKRQIPVVQRAIAQVALGAVHPLAPVDDVWGDDASEESSPPAQDGPEPDAADDQQSGSDS